MQLSTGVLHSPLRAFQQSVRHKHETANYAPFLLLLPNCELLLPVIHVLFRAFDAFKSICRLRRSTRFIVYRCIYQTRQWPPSQEGVWRALLSKRQQCERVGHTSHRKSQNDVFYWALAFCSICCSWRVFFRQFWNMLKKRWIILVWKTNLKKDSSNNIRMSHCIYECIFSGSGYPFNAHLNLP